MAGNASVGMIASATGSTMADNDWSMFVSNLAVDTADAALCEQGAGAEFCFYHLVARWSVDPLPLHTNTNQPLNLLNTFKVASNGLPFLAAGSTIGFIGWERTQNNEVFVPLTDYDGIFSFKGLVTDPAGVCSLDLYDGDSDSAVDSDDPNTPNVDPQTGGFYPFPVSDAAAIEGAIPGVPLDENPDPGVAIGGNINYTITPDEASGTANYGVAGCCANHDPSGNQEIELYRIASSAPGCPVPVLGDQTYDPDGAGPQVAAAPDAIVNELSAGFHNVDVLGMDSGNTNFINLNVDVFAGEPFDFGDAPVSYGTLIADNGAQHGLDARLILGTDFDGEFDGTPSAGADGDDLLAKDDEDGVSAFAPLNVDDVNQIYAVEVTVLNELSEAANVYGWIDFDGDGVFEVGESASAPVNPGDTLVTLNFLPAVLVAGDTYARFRITTDDGISTTTPGGEAENGEVEDYKLTIGSGECIPCIQGQKEITLSMTDWSHYRDDDEIVRVRVGDLLGQFSGSDFAAPILFQGTVPDGGSISITVPDQYLGQPLTVSVEGDHHHIEYGKARFFPDCQLKQGIKSGNSYIEFTVTELTSDTGQTCECVECETGPAEITFKITNTHGRDQGETIRVRVGDLSGSLGPNPDDVANPVIFTGVVPNGGSFQVTVPEQHRGKTLSITVQGNNHTYEYVKAKFDADCSLTVGDFSTTNGYLKVKVVDLVGDTGEICPLECPPDTAGYVRDYFSSKSYSNNDGNRDWSGPWEESDSAGGGASSGNVRIYRGKLKLRKPGSSVEREVNVCASSEVWLKFKYVMSYKVDPDDRVAVEVSPDGGVTWNTIDEYSGRHGWTTRQYDISEYASDKTRVRFRISNKYGGSG